MTNEGIDFAKYCSLVLDANEAILHDLEKGRERSGVIRITASYNVTISYLLDSISRFREKHEDITFEILPNDYYVNIIEKNIDIAIRAGQSNESGLSFKTSRPGVT